MDFLGVLFTGLGVYLGVVYFIHAILVKDPASRRRALDRLHTPLFAPLYRHTLRNGLAWLAWFFGGRRPNTLTALGVCVALSLTYSTTLFLLSWALGGLGNIGATEILSNHTPNWRRWMALILLFTIGGSCFVVFRNIQRIVETVDRRIIRTFLPRHWSHVYVPVATSFLVIIVVLVGIAVGVGTVVGAEAIAGVSVATAVSVATGTLLITGPVAEPASEAGADPLSGVVVGTGAVAGTAVATVAIFIFGEDERLVHSNIVTFVLFLLILPTFNALLDWFSWWISRSLGRRILRTQALWRTIPIHALIDLAAAVVLLGALTILLTATIEGVNLWGTSYNLPPPLALEGLVEATRSAPFGAEGLWVTLMLLSTLLPTALHLAMLFMGFAAIHAPRWLRESVARNLEGNPAQIQLIGLALYLTTMPLIGVTLAGLSFWGTFVLLDSVGASVADGLAELALWTMGWVRSL